MNITDTLVSAMFLVLSSIYMALKILILENTITDLLLFFYGKAIGNYSGKSHRDMR